VTVKHDRLDIKRLERVDESGLHLWRPVLQAEFPIGGEALAAAFSAWGLPAPPTDVPPHTLSDLIRNVVVPHRELRIVTLTKRRLRLTVGPCRGERGQMTVGRHSWNTVSFEDDDPQTVLATLRELGLDSENNEDYPRALKRILGFHDHSSEPRLPPLH
jgi:hypothetical protein